MRFLILLLALLCVAPAAIAQETKSQTCQCKDCGAGCKCECPPGQCVCPNCPGNKAPAMLTGEPSLDELFGGTEAARDDQWYADVEKSLQYLYRRQEDILVRLAKVERTLIQVRTTAGQTVPRAVPIRSGYGQFQLAPGERLVGYQDVVSGRWVSVSGQPQSVIQHAGYRAPIHAYSTPAMQVRTYAPQGMPMRGAIRITSGGCTNCG